MILLDSNVLSELMLKRPQPDVVAWVDRQPRLSIWTTSVTVFEIRFGIERLPLGQRRAALQDGFERLLDLLLGGRVAPLDHKAAVETAILSAARAATGRPMEWRDAMIAGIAIANHATVATRNVRHFEDLACPVVNPWA
jgi:predicted nucleic acid-binding protein